MSNTIEVLKGIKEVFANKFEGATFKNPSYSRQGDVHSTGHYYSLVTILANGAILELQLNTIYIPYSGATYTMDVFTTSSTGQTKHLQKEISKNQISVEGIKEVLKGWGMKF